MERRSIAAGYHRASCALLEHGRKGVIDPSAQVLTALQNHDPPWRHVRRELGSCVASVERRDEYDLRRRFEATKRGKGVHEHRRAELRDPHRIVSAEEAGLAMSRKGRPRHHANSEAHVLFFRRWRYFATRGP